MARLFFNLMNIIIYIYIKNASITRIYGLKYNRECEIFTSG